MKKNNYNIKGIKHISKPDIYTWQYIEKTFKNLIKSYCYDEIKLPLIEKTKLFTLTLGKDSDIITKEMFSLQNDLTLLPEGTTSCLKSLILDGSLRNMQKTKIWYISPMFRKENPQKGRNRLFYQIGLESFGEKSYEIDLEHIIIINKLFKKLNINDTLLEINYIDNKEKSIYKSILKKFILKNIKHLTNINETRLNSNPLLILDKIDKKNIKNIPASINYLNNKKKHEFVKILYCLKKTNINFIFNKYLVRGLNYYDEIVYEWTSKINKKNITLCAGGRYNNLSQHFNTKDVFSTGCALGIDRTKMKIENKIENKIHAIIIFEKKIPIYLNIKTAEYIRKKLTKINIINGYINLSIEQQIKKAKKNNIHLFIIITKENIQNQTITINYKNICNKQIHFKKISRYIWQNNLNL